MSLVQIQHRPPSKTLFFEWHTIMKYLLIAIINIIYGVLMLLTLDSSTPGFTIVLSIGGILTIIGLVGFVLWLRMVITSVKDTPQENSAMLSWWGLVKSFDVVLIIGLLFRAFILQPYIVDGSSMETNFHDKEILVIDKITDRFHDFRRGDVVVFQAPKTPSEDYIKRVIAFPGETVIIENGKVYVNGFLLDEPYLPKGTLTLTDEKVFRFTLEPNQYFVMGDNRNNSSDSREWGAVPRVNLIGRAWIIVSPWNSKGFVSFPLPEIEKNIQVPISSIFNIFRFSV
jgi:signal peptidase I